MFVLLKMFNNTNIFTETAQSVCTSIITHFYCHMSSYRKCSKFFWTYVYIV